MKNKIGLTNNIQLRFLGPSDIDEVKSLCMKWFPIEYPDIWYQDITSSPRFYSLAAVLNKRIIGILVAEVKSISKCNPEDAGILGGRLTKDTKVCYILSLGVVDEYRKNGIDVMQYGFSLVCRIQPCRLPFILANSLWSWAMRLAFEVQRRFQLFPPDEKEESEHSSLKDKTDSIQY